MALRWDMGNIDSAIKRPASHAVTQSFLNRLEASPIIGLGTKPWSMVQSFNVSGAVDKLGYVVYA